MEYGRNMIFSTLCKVYDRDILNLLPSEIWKIVKNDKLNKTISIKNYFKIKKELSRYLFSEVKQNGYKRKFVPQRKNVWIAKTKW